MEKNLLKSILFNFHFYLLTIMLVIIMSPVLILPFVFIKFIAKIWGGIMVLGMKIWLGLDLKIVGNYNKKKPCIIAVKHQSAWETVLCTSLFEMPSIVLKKELIYLPIIGLYFLKGRAIPIVRSNTIEALKKIVKFAKVNINKGSSILIFPQGTRVPLNASTKNYPYQPGIYFLYSQCNIPVIPVAHNAGLFWPKNSFLKYPNRHKSKTVTIEIMDEIPIGLDKKTFMNKLEKSIEDKTRKLIREESHG